MSQTYRICGVATRACIAVDEQSDRVTRRIVLPELRGLTKDELGAVLADVLRARPQWREESAGVFVRDRGDVRERLDAGSQQLELTTATSEVLVDLEGQVRIREGASDEEVAAARQRREAELRAQAHRDLTRSVGAERAAQRELARRIEAEDDQRAAELKQLLCAVTSEGLKRLAPRLGTVVSVEEKHVDDDYELVIRIEA